MEVYFRSDSRKYLRNDGSGIISQLDNQFWVDPRRKYFRKFGYVIFCFSEYFEFPGFISVKKYMILVLWAGHILVFISKTLKDINIDKRYFKITINNVPYSFEINVYNWPDGKVYKGTMNWSDTQGITGCVSQFS